MRASNKCAVLARLKDRQHNSLRLEGHDGDEDGN
jgi:hypothetical protein